MLHDQPLLCSGLARQLLCTAEGTERGSAYVPVGKTGRLEGTEVRGAASNVFVKLSTPFSELNRLAKDGTQIQHWLLTFLQCTVVCGVVVSK